MNKQKISGTYVVPSPIKYHKHTYEVFCKHQGHLINQGIILCNAGHDPSKCETCEFREKETVTATVSSTSTENSVGSHRQWYMEYHQYGAYWAKFWLTSGKRYVKTPKQVIRWILESHYKRKFK